MRRAKPRPSTAAEGPRDRFVLICLPLVLHPGRSDSALLPQAMKVMANTPQADLITLTVKNQPGTWNPGKRASPFKTAGPLNRPSKRNMSPKRQEPRPSDPGRRPGFFPCSRKMGGGRGLGDEQHPHLRHRSSIQSRVSVNIPIRCGGESRFVPGSPRPCDPQFKSVSAHAVLHAPF